MNHGIDVHTHVVPEHFPTYVGMGKNVPWPSMVHDNCGHAQVMISGKNYRRIGQACWDIGCRQRDLDGMQLAHQVLSPMPELLSYWLDIKDAKPLIRHMNDSIAQMVSQTPIQFSGLGAVPLQDVDAAIEELRYVMLELKLRGVEIATHVNGVSIGDPRFEPFFAAAVTFNAAVFVHGLRPAGSERLVGPEALAQVVAFPGDVALAAASMITGGMMERHPSLRICFSHGGGSFPTVLPRLRHGWKSIPMVRDSFSVDPSVTAKRFYADTLTYDEQTLRLALKTFGDDKLMIGTDYPFPVADGAPLATIAALGLDEEKLVALRETNARRFLGMSLD